MKTKNNRWFVTIITLIIIGIAIFTMTNCFNDRASVNQSEFNAIISLIDKGEDNSTGADGKFYLFELEKENSKAPTLRNNIVNSLKRRNFSNKQIGIIVDEATKSYELDLSAQYIYYQIKSVVINNYVIDFDILYTVTANADGNAYVKEDYITGALSFSSVFARTTQDIEKFQRVLGSHGVSFSFTDPNAGSIWSTLLPLGGTILIAVVFFILMVKTQGGTKGAMNFAKTNARMNQNIRVRFSDVAGAEEEKAELAEVVDFLKAPRKYSELGARIPKGVLLVGPPGTGKTLFAKAVAGEAGVPFFSISGSDFVEMFVGVGASRVRDLFDVAKKSMPCIVFIDEIDAVGRQRGTGMGGGHDEREQTLNQLLVQMDGFETNDGIIVIAATNRADILDPALLRPGRFDRQIYVNVPDVKGREAILRVHARNKPMAKDVNFKTVARMTSGFSGADIENLLNEAAILAARNNRRFITNKDLYEGINKVLLGPQKKSRLVTETDKRITAYHESGHAILARLLPNCDPVHEVSIIPRGQAAGYTMTRPENDDNHLTKSKLLDDIVMTLGGRVAEELIIKDISAGASGDIQAVTKRARLMVTEWGMSEKVGPISYGSDKEIFIGRDMASHVNYSESTASTIDDEIKRIVNEGLEKARKILGENKKLLDTMARILVERETIFTEEVDMIMEGKSVEEIIAFMDKNEDSLSENPFERQGKKKGEVVSESEKKVNGMPENQTLSDKQVDQSANSSDDNQKVEQDDNSNK